MGFSTARAAERGRQQLHGAAEPMGLRAYAPDEKLSEY